MERDARQRRPADGFRPVTRCDDTSLVIMTRWDARGRVLEPAWSQAKSVVRSAAVGGVLLATAMAIAALIVTVHLTLTGDLASRTLWAAIAAVLVPALLIFAGRFGDLISRVGKARNTGSQARGPRPLHLGALTALTAMLSALGLAQGEWLPGVLADCYSPGWGVAVFVLARDGQCYGLIDDAGSRLRGPDTFGDDLVARSLQRDLLTGNRPLRSGDLTVVWVAPLSCKPAPTEPDTCLDTVDYPAERQQLRALRLAQQALAAETKYRLHVVIANAGQGTEQGDLLAQLITDRRDFLGDRLAVIFGGDSRDVTQQAIQSLLNAGIPVISPNLAGDLNRAGHPFVDRPGYLQLSASNNDYAGNLLKQLVTQNASGYRLTVYQAPSPGDQYTTSLVNDVMAAAHDHPGAISAAHVTRLSDLDASICADAPGSRNVLFYADRWVAFDAFVRRVDDLCRYAGPSRVIADVSASRFMASNALRANSSADWSLDYYATGRQCAELADPHLRQWLTRAYPALMCSSNKSAPATGTTTDPYCTLDAAESTSYPCRPTDLGPYFTPTWDAVMLADRLPPLTEQERATKAGRDRYLTTLRADGVPFSGGSGKVRDQAILVDAQPTPVVPIELLHVDHIDRLTAAPYRLSPR